MTHRSWKRNAIVIATAASALILSATIWVEREARDQRWTLPGNGPDRALVLFHPSRDAAFSDDLSLAVSAGLQGSGFTVDRMTTTAGTPGRPSGYRVVVIVSNTYFLTPDLPTLRYLKRARFDGIPVIGFMAGAGSTARAEAILGRALRSAGASSVSTHSFWLWRPNDETSTGEANRLVALDRAKFLGRCLGKLLECGV
jgi:hypothetical protein